MKTALVRESDGYVENVILVGEDFEAPDGLTLHELSDTDTVSPGDIRQSDGTYQRRDLPEPTPEVPALTPLEVLEADPEFKAMTSTEKRLARVVVKAFTPQQS